MSEESQFRLPPVDDQMRRLEPFVRGLDARHVAFLAEALERHYRWGTTHWQGKHAMGTAAIPKLAVVAAAIGRANATFRVPFHVDDRLLALSALDHYLRPASDPAATGHHWGKDIHSVRCVGQFSDRKDAVFAREFPGDYVVTEAFAAPYALATEQGAVMGIGGSVRLGPFEAGCLAMQLGQADLVLVCPDYRFTQSGHYEVDGDGTAVAWDLRDEDGPKLIGLPDGELGSPACHVPYGLDPSKIYR